MFVFVKMSLCLLKHLSVEVLKSGFVSKIVRVAYFSSVKIHGKLNRMQYW